MANKPWLVNYDEGVPISIDYPDIPLHALLGNSAQKYPEATCTDFKGAAISYAEMDDLTNSLAAGLIELGLKKGDRVGLFIPNTPQFVIAYFGVLKAGGVVVATNPFYQPREIIFQALDSGMRFMIVMSNFYDRVKAVQPETKIEKIIVTNIKEALPPFTSILFTLLREKKSGFRVTLGEGDLWLKDILAKHKGAGKPNIDISKDDIALFQYSGGTTGVPKAAVAMHRNLVANALQIRSWMPLAIDGAETVLMAIPLYHVYGMIAGMCFALVCGANLVMIPDPRDVDDLLENIQKHKPTIYPGIPALYNQINNNPDVLAGKYDLSSIKACISGSAPLLRETKETFEALTGGTLIEGFGLSEAPTATHCNPLSGENKIGSIGMPMSDVNAKIISIDDGVTELPIGEIGELVIQGPMVMKGYHNMPTETENTLRGGWLYTGDIAMMDEDGYFYIVDRKKEMIKPSGFQVWPREVEEVIKEMPQVFEVGVAGVPDAISGEAVKAWVVLKDGESLGAEEVIQYCKSQLAGYKAPKQVEFVDELPKTPIGKLLRRELVRTHKESLESTKE